MTTSDGGSAWRARAVPGSSLDSFMESKLHWPRTRQHWVRRERLVEQVHRAVGRQVALVAAPAGYGKTILLAQWLARSDGLKAAWVSLDPGDNDPQRLWTHVAAALDRAGCVVPTIRPTRTRRRHAAGTSADAELPKVLTALAATPEEIVLILDDFHFIQDQECHAQVEFLVDNLPPQAHLVISTRADPGLRLGRIRASGELAEIRASDLCFSAAETAELIAHEQIQLSGTSFTQLLERTEGWPAGLYLAILSLAGRPDPDDFVRRFSGGNRFIGDYLVEEVLSRQSDPVREFMMSVSILDRFCASLCDHVTGISGSANLLHDLERTNLFLVPLDEDRTWYRFHYLFAAVARSELEMTHPGLVRDLHARATEWFRSNGHVDEAVTHALAAGDAAAASDLAQTHWLQFVEAGRLATVLGWMGSIGAPSSDDSPAASVTAAWIAALVGDETTLSERLNTLDDFPDFGPLPDGARSVESAVAMIRGFFGYDGPVEMLAAAKHAVSIETDSRSPFYSIARTALGHAAYVAGDLDEARDALALAAGNGHAPGVIKAMSLTVQALVESERGEPARSRECAELAIDIIEDTGLLAMPQGSLPYLALGLARAGAGRPDDALAALQEGLAVRRRSSAYGPWSTIHHLLITARIATEAGRVELASELLDSIGLLMNRFTSGTAAMSLRIAAVHQLLRDDPTDTPTVALTGRELDVLRLLQGTLSLKQIAGELYLSSNTVKTHSRAVYRKLGAHTRSEAVRIGRRQQLI